MPYDLKLFPFQLPLTWNDLVRVWQILVFLLQNFGILIMGSGSSVYSM